ncbi:hypothetical protein PPEP_a1890 [Pseudoalteromonas peptidolytica F12-50-A1]|uniref:Uncharacterized protein n=1 Tax=Pseudoalteromonas peptidolytica F12-50-A1 TaxID=1315280 RepID=A0A8I0MX44_9GAMM|nr:hypothetical protein [Pseudoalteromonas peptidolytica F12-50-A1]
MALIQIQSPPTDTAFYNPCFLVRFFMPRICALKIAVSDSQQVDSATQVAQI